MENHRRGKGLSMSSTNTSFALDGHAEHFSPHLARHRSQSSQDAPVRTRVTLSVPRPLAGFSGEDAKSTTRI